MQDELVFYWSTLCLLFTLLLGNHQAFQVSSIDGATIHGKFSKGIINLRGGEVLTPGHQRVTEHFSVNFAINFKCRKCTEDNLVVISSSSHLLSKHGHHLCKVNRSRSLSKHTRDFTVGHRSANLVEGRLQVVSGHNTILVSIDDTESLFELLDLFLAEQGEDVGTGSLGLLSHDANLCVK